MYRNKFGSKNQVRFDTKADYYELLGYLAKGDGSTKLVWEHNDQQGAWAEEGRIQFYSAPPSALRANLTQTAGNQSIFSRVNCNAFIEHIVEHHHFNAAGLQDTQKILSSIPAAHINDFQRGLAL